MLYNIISRGNNIDSFIKREELNGIKEFKLEIIPGDILNFTGNIKELSYPPQGMCSLVVILKSNSKKYILKIAKGDYRGRELYAEYSMMRELASTSIPVPIVHLFTEKDNLYFLLRDYAEGVQLNTLFNECKDESIRMHMIDMMAELLSNIHEIKIENYEYNNFIDSQLFFAEQHLNNNTIDLEDFEFEGQFFEPLQLFEWLKKNRPLSGQVSLIHGDFRPKNMLWSENRITSIVDWAFCDIGDPYYDITLFLYYLRNEAERERFMKKYGLDNFDEERIKYFNFMIPFINI